MPRLARYPIKIQLPTAVRVACCCFSFVDIIIKIGPSRRDKRHCCLLSVLEIGDIHTEVIRGISDILRFLCRFPAAARRTGAAMTNEATQRTREPLRAFLQQPMAPSSRGAFSCRNRRFCLLGQLRPPQPPMGAPARLRRGRVRLRAWKRRQRVKESLRELTSRFK